VLCTPAPALRALHPCATCRVSHRPKHAATVPSLGERPYLKVGNGALSTTGSLDLQEDLSKRASEESLNKADVLAKKAARRAKKAAWAKKRKAAKLAEKVQEAEKAQAAEKATEVAKSLAEVRSKGRGLRDETREVRLAKTREVRLAKRGTRGET